MAKSDTTANLADMNDPASEPPAKRDGRSRDQQAIAPTREALKAQQRADDDGMAGLARKATAEQAVAAQERAASHTSEQAERVREAGESFDAGSFAHAASERIAENLSQAAQSIRETDLSHLADDVATFARRQPLLFFGGAALLGFAAGRMLKASERAEHDDEEWVS
ncbi:MAG: hypothetical protein AAF914_05925 [Pseudomonadota bacterium]